MPDLVLAGKRVAVTGASRGLGRAFAERCAAHGADLVLNGRDEDALAETRDLVARYGRGCEIVSGSVTDAAVCEAVVRRCVDVFGGIDCLVNNAGITRDRTLAKMTADEFDEVIAVNLRGTWACTKAAAAAMRETGGSIVGVVSNTAFSGAVGQTNYGASKAGVAGMLRTWTRELARYRIRVNAIWPIAETGMTRGLIDSLTRARADAGSPVAAAADLGFGRPEDVASVVVFLAGDASDGVTGQVITFNGRKLALWSHPREVAIRERGAWTPAELAAEFAGPLSAQLQPLYDAFD
jgi:NAD(P)-dependent dehydrogenase (short-subunit alcohol dehydrogenase family)